MVLSLPEQERVHIQLGKLCCTRAALYGEELVRLEYLVRGNRVTLIESRPLFIDPRIWNNIKVCQFEYSSETLTWTLFWYDRKNRRQPYPTGRNRDTLEKLVTEVLNDPTGIFWE